VSFGVFGGIQDGSLDVESARFRIAAAEDEDQVLPAERLRHEFPSLAGLGVAAECSLHQRRRIELGFHGFHQIFSGVLSAAQARLFFFDFADLAVDLLARGFGQGIEEFLKAFGLAEFAGEEWVDICGIQEKTLPRMTRIGRVGCFRVRALVFHPQL
jgi:hypothetical protein